MRLRSRGINALVVDGRRVDAARFAAAAKAARTLRLTLIAPRPAKSGEARSIERFCRAPDRRGDLCALGAASRGAALRLANRVPDDAVVVVRVAGPMALRRLPVVARPARILAIVPLPARTPVNALWLRAAAARSDVDVAVVGTSTGAAALRSYVQQLDAQLGQPDRRAPSSPASLAASAATETSLKLSWRPARDNRSVRGYGIYVAGRLVGSSPRPSFSLTGLACEQTHLLSVDAYDFAGNRSPARKTSARTGTCRPPARATTVVNAPPGTVVRSNTFYRDPLGELRYPDDLRHVSVTGARNMPDYVLNWKDVWVEGKPDAYMNLGPGIDQDLLQIKRYPVTAQLPEDLTFRYFRMHDLTRTGSFHSDGLQLMAGRRIRFLDGVAERINTQPFFLRDAGPEAGGGPIEDITFERIRVTGSTEAFYAFRVAGDDEAGVPGRYVPTRVRIVDCSGDKGVSIDRASLNLGSRVVNYRQL